MQAAEKSMSILNADLSLRLSDDHDALAASSVRLLECIDATGSITQAAKECGISYRTAWQSIERLQNRSYEPVVMRMAGGRDGGGTRLTLAGRKLVAMFRAAETEHRRFVALLGEGLADYEKYSKFIRRWFMKTSVRNQLYGNVQVVSKGAVNTEVVIGIGGEDRLTAMITNDGAEEMELSIGMEVAALIRESAIILCTGERIPKVSARNRLKGKVLRCHEGVVCSEVQVELPGAKILHAMISFESLAEMDLWPGSEVWGCFKASDVILATQE
ncbi:LysR family transcriptional regulator [Mariprofundus erugo]|uniref:LysR family transcriptional regulator n=1 Tax=Mariprofundus erugo TaxID=2528639 RepID=A0A5R9GME4_9PROT|nr:TOBE domain-containing protein [Mariprofundus erugo]TLS65467.1 LysR family transcriptional regulator [Mariprofundus erugo]